MTPTGRWGQRPLQKAASVTHRRGGCPHPPAQRPPCERGLSPPLGGDWGILNGIACIVGLIDPRADDIRPYKSRGTETAGAACGRPPF